MGWTQAQRYYAALRDVEAQLDGSGGPLPWRAGYAEIFGDRHGLLLALARRWQLLVEAWSDSDVTVTELGFAHPGLVRVLRQHGLARDVLAPAGAA